MCVAVGTGPAEVVELDAATFDALEAAVARRWSPELELAAVAAEIASAQLVAFVAAHSPKGANVPPVLHVPRPGSSTSSSSSTGPERLTPAAFATLTGARRIAAPRRED